MRPTGQVRRCFGTDRNTGSNWRLNHFILKGHAFGIVFRKPRLRGVDINGDLEMLGVPDLLARIHVDQHGHWYPSIGPCGNRNERRPQLGGTGLGPLVLNALILYRLYLTRIPAVRS